jgi:FixJ family two-component response regulator
LSTTPLISIVDDDGVVGRAVESFVTSIGYLACTFTSAKAFLQSSEMAETSCLISDVQMPGLSGIELQDRLGELGLNIPMIFMTAYPDEAVRRRALGKGAVCFLHKPFDAKSLIECVENALNTRSGKTTGD